MRHRVLGTVGALLLFAVTACQSGPPSITDLKVGKDKEVTQPSGAFDAAETIFAAANLTNPPSAGKIRSRLLMVEVAGFQPGPVPGAEQVMDLVPGAENAKVSFTAPNSGWPDGKYQFEMVLLDEKGEQKAVATADVTTSGNTAAAAAADAPADAATDTAAEAGTDTAGDTATSEEPQQ